MRNIAKFLYFKVFRWKLIGNFPDVRKCVVIVVPHTHWHDFLLGLLVRKIVNKEIHYIGKKSLFKPPLGWFFRWTGGTPVDRSKNQKMVDAVVSIFNERNIFRFALAPEGTRKKVTALKTGFYYIAKKAGVPIVMVAFDFGEKHVKISEAIWTSDNLNKDFRLVRQFYKGVKGRIPEYSYG
ncbi:MAG: 1-acyl-sn-glycerol-3-phosphate acyltransferase [Bacteroidota bacterium]